MIDYVFPEAMKYFFLYPSVVLYIIAPTIFLVFFILTLRLLKEWSDSY